MQAHVEASEAACEALMAKLVADQQRLEHMAAGFRAEVATEFGVVRADLDAVKAEQARQGERLSQVQETLPEVLRC